MGARPTIDWDTAQRVGELIAGSPPSGRPAGRRVQPLAYDFAKRVSVYTGLELPAQLPPLEMVDRSAWIAANLQTMRPLLDPLVDRLSASDAEGAGDAQAGPGPRRALLGRALEELTGPVYVASAHLLGAQVGALAGMLSQRVLGQYEVSLLDDSAQPRLLLLAPNLEAAARTLRVDRDQLISWVAIHEITHAVQFSGAPWLRGHLGGMLRELLEGMRPLAGGSLIGRARGGDVRALVERVRHGELLRIGLGDERWALVERMQATMSLIEGHAEHTMDAVGVELLPSLPRLRAAMTRRRESRGLPWRVLERLLGLELKLRQYEVGRRFCDAVVDAGGPETLALVWRSPESLPTASELADPARWLQRARVPA